MVAAVRDVEVACGIAGQGVGPGEVGAGRGAPVAAEPPDFGFGPRHEASGPVGRQAEDLKRRAEVDVAVRRQDEAGRHGEPPKASRSAVAQGAAARDDCDVGAAHLENGAARGDGHEVAHLHRDDARLGVGRDDDRQPASGRVDLDVPGGGLDAVEEDLVVGADRIEAVAREHERLAGPHPLLREVRDEGGALEARELLRRRVQGDGADRVLVQRDGRVHQAPHRGVLGGRDAACAGGGEGVRAADGDAAEQGEVLGGGEALEPAYHGEGGRAAVDDEGARGEALPAVAPLGDEGAEPACRGSRPVGLAAELEALDRFEQVDLVEGGAPGPEVEREAPVGRREARGDGLAVIGVDERDGGAVGDLGERRIGLGSVGFLPTQLSAQTGLMGSRSHHGQGMRAARHEQHATQQEKAHPHGHA
ncbi:hypothetical protein D3C86_1060680 [compost metagenome]